MDKVLERTFSLKTRYRWPIHTWKDVQCHYSLVKATSKTMICHLHPSGWLQSKSEIITGKNMKILESSYTAGRKVKWSSYFEKQEVPPTVLPYDTAVQLTPKRNENMVTQKLTQECL